MYVNGKSFMVCGIGIGKENQLMYRFTKVTGGKSQFENALPCHLIFLKNVLTCWNPCGRIQLFININMTLEPNLGG
jgi:hypothetical protein